MVKPFVRPPSDFELTTANYYSRRCYGTLYDFPPRQRADPDSACEGTGLQHYPKSDPDEPPRVFDGVRLCCGEPTQG
jgi:hypothetical protein